MAAGHAVFDPKLLLQPNSLMRIDVRSFSSNLAKAPRIQPFLNRRTHMRPSPSLSASFAASQKISWSFATTMQNSRWNSAIGMQKSYIPTARGLCSEATAPHQNESAHGSVLPEKAHEKQGWISSLPSWLNWLVASVAALWTGHNMSVQKLEDDAEKVEEVVEQVAELVENTATATQKIAETVAGDFPEGTRIHDVAETVEKISETVAQDAHKTEAIVDKIESAEQIVANAVEAIEEVISSGKTAKPDGASIKPKL